MNTLAYLASSSAMKEKSFLTLTPGVNVIKLSSLRRWFGGKIKQVSEASLMFENKEGILTEGEGSVQLTSLYKFWNICFAYWNYIFLFYKTTFLKDEVNRTDPSPSGKAFLIKVILGFCHYSKY